MNSRSGFELDDQHERHDTSPAVEHAAAGTEAWQAAARDTHRGAPSVEHGEFYELTREWVTTLAAIGSQMRVVGRQVAGYADSVPAGRRVYDDERAAQLLDVQAARVTDVALMLNSFWSLIGRMGVEENPTVEGGDVEGAPRTGVTS
ncbi:MAG: hypothetical protein ACRDRK_23425 [Pseudonocardia sp.]